ncbi:glycoside hydrolase family 3 protein [Nocardioides cheoyonin]|uniref:glycoside hydrolase family 3 protein n=1 Tax=Nocardioides cheoyonin TaxID=3156615 RepID=UPI0032B533FB
MSAAGDLRRLALEVVMPGFVGTTPPDWLLDATEAGLGGVALFGQNVGSEEQVQALTSRLHAAGPVLVASDEEGGSVTRLDLHGGSRWPGAAALGVLDDVDATHEVARGLGLQARAAGVDLVLAPVLDVNSEPDNPVIGVRSFGADPALVARHGAAAVRGLAEAGVAACAKHFPGHGDTRTDSHVGLPVVGVDEATWRARDLPPFAAAVAAGVPCVMTAHLVLSWLDERPATLSAPVLRVLREELGFAGVIATDALDMKAVSARTGRGPAAVAALAAGADLVCIGNPAFPEPYDDGSALEEVVAAIVAAVADASLPADRLEEAAGRVAALAATVGAGDPAPAERVDEQTQRSLGARVAANALTTTGDVRLRGDAVVLAPAAALGYAAGRRPSELLAELARRRPGWPVVDVTDAAAAAAAARAAAPAREVLVVVEGNDPRHDLVGAVLAQVPDAVVAYGGLARPDDPGARTLHTHGTGAATAVAAADVLLGPLR